MTASWQIPGTPSTGDRKQHDPAPDHIEANALLAVQEGQLVEAQHAIDKMLPSERRRWL